MDEAVFSQFVGRTGPRDRINAAFRDSVTGRARLVLVSGEAGIGKTALLAESVNEASRDALSVWGTCWDAARAPGYWPWSQVLRDIVTHADREVIDAMTGEDRLDLARLVPELQENGATDDQHEFDSDRARFRFFDAVARLLERLARRRPLIVTLDDLQWADSSSLALLEFVVRAHRPVPLLILGAYRHDELRSDVADMLATISVRADNVRLQGLSASEVHTLLAHMSGEELAARWGNEVHGRTGGHPFLVREVSHALATQAATEGVPDAAHGLIAGRISRLSTSCRQLLDAAAVAGNDLRPDVLADVLDMTPAEVVSRIDEAVRAEVLTTGDGAGAVRFAHDLYRETIYSDLPASSRLSLHQQVGSSLEGRLARGGTVFAGEVARHFAAAAAIDGPHRALHWAIAAASADRDRLAFAEAAAQLARVRNALDGAGVAVPADALVDLLVAQADAESRAGAPDRARELLSSAHAQAVRLDDPERLAAIALGMQRLGARFAMPRDEIVSLLEEARLAVEGRAPAVEAEVTASLARELHHSVPKDRARARPLSDHAVAIARELGDPATLAACLLAQHDALWTPGAGADRVEVSREIVALAERIGDNERRSQGHLLTANALLESGSPTFRTELDSFLRLEDSFSQPRHDYVAMTRRAAMALLDGSIDDGECLVHEAAALGERIREPDTGNVRMSQLLEVARARGEPAQLCATAQMAIDWWVGVPSHAHAVAAALFAEGGDLDSARRALDTVLELDTWQEDRSYLWSVFVGGLTTAAARLDDVDLSRQLLAALVPLGDTCGVNGAVVCFTGSHAHWAGVAARTVGQPEDARQLLQRALVVHQRLGARAWEAATRAELDTLDTPSPAKTADAVCHHEGEVWTIAFRGQAARLRDAKGLHDLVVLLARPGQDVHVLDLAASAVRGEETTSPVLDRRARAEFQRRITELDEDLAEAERNNDIGRVERIETERDALLAELRRATGHTGKDRGLGPRTVERARKAVTARLRDTIRRIEEAIPDLGAHLDRSIITGNHCRYQPDAPITWDLHGRREP